MRRAVGITCYPTLGGSGIVATEIGTGLARRGHDVHFICTDLPARLDPAAAGVSFHPVQAEAYPVFSSAPISLALASQMIAVCEAHHLDVLHVHYAVPHATSAWMAADALGPAAPKIVTTLHGTDITHIGAHKSYRSITRHSVARSDAVTVPSAFLRDAVWAQLDLTPERLPVEVIPNFIDSTAWRPAASPDRPALDALFGAPVAGPVVLHVSNLRPVKQLPVVVETFAHIADTGARLVIAGDGPDRVAAERQVAALGLGGQVAFAGAPERLPELVRECDIFFLPSRSESFGLAALEAASSGLAVVASAVGGLPEVFSHQRTALLAAPDDVPRFAAHLRALITDRALRQRLGAAARQDVLDRFQADTQLDRYEALYERLLTGCRR